MAMQARGAAPKATARSQKQRAAATGGSGDMRLTAAEDCWKRQVKKEEFGIRNAAGQTPAGRWLFLEGARGAVTLRARRACCVEAVGSSGTIAPAGSVRLAI
jgi:hypothetical protein